MTSASDAARRVRDSAFNKTKTFFNDHGLMVEKIDQENDIGIDAILTLARREPDAGRAVNLQIKGGRKYKRQTQVDARLSRFGLASFRSADWNLRTKAPRGCEGHHVIDMDARLRRVWSNSRPVYAMVQDPDDGELYFGNLARMADNEGLDQDFADSYERLGKPDDGSAFHRHLARIHKRLSGLSEDQLQEHKTWVPMYPDLRLTPDGLDRFLSYALQDARQPMPDRASGIGPIPVLVRYPDATIGPSREVMDVMRRMEEDSRH